MSTTPVVENLWQAQQYAARASCAGCQKKTLSAYQVQKEGPNQGRLFVKCRHCGSFEWLSAAQAADPELERAQSAARPCPKCGKRRHARRVSKDGANKGRLFLVCADPACDSFEWASPPVGQPQPATPRPDQTPGQRTEEEFLADLRDNPNDEATRLIYADWLDEHDQPAQAELIRVQLDCERLEPDGPAWGKAVWRALEILAERQEAWVGRLRSIARGWLFVRGLIDEVEIDAAAFAEHAEEVLRVAPAAGFRVHVDGRPGVQTLVGCRRLRQVRRLALLGGHLGGTTARLLAESPNVTNLKVLSLRGLSLGQPGVQALALSRYLKNLEALDLTENNLAGSAVPILASSTNLPRLRRLVLANNLLQDSDARALARSPELRELQELDLSDNALTREGVEALHRSPLGARLRRLIL
jgi:uncharacterized protein (TIGR02996 family)